MDNSPGIAIEGALENGSISAETSVSLPTDAPAEATSSTENGLPPERTTTSPPAPSQIELVYLEDVNRLQVILKAGDADEILSMESLQSLLQQRGFSNFVFHSGALDKVLNLASKGELGTFEIGRRAEFLKFAFDLDATDHILYAVLTLSDKKQKVSQTAIEHWLRKQGYDSFFYKTSPNQQDAIATLFINIEKGKEGRFEFSRKLDATVTVKVSDDHMQAYITTRPAFGGDVLDKQQIISALKNAEIDQRFYNNELITALLNGPAVENKLLGNGVSAVHGNNARLEFLVQETIRKLGSEDAHGNINPHQLNEFVIVEKGTPVLRRDPATAGTDGYNINGTLLAATPGKDLNFSSSMSGVEPDPEDENLLIASIKGHPTLLRTTVKVDPVLHLEEVGIKSGDIDFDGSVTINGDINAGMVVKASGDVHVNGTIEKATIIATNNISVSGGVIGGDSARDSKKNSAEEQQEAPEEEEDTQHVFKGFLKAGGSISAKYINHAELECEQDLIVAEYLLHSNSIVHGQVLLGQAGGKGCLIGGHCYAKQGIIANFLGSETYLKTTLAIGYPIELILQLKEMSEQKEKKHAIINKLNAGLQKFAETTKAGLTISDLAEKTSKMQNAVKLVTAEIANLDMKTEALLAEHQQTEQLHATVTDTAFPNLYLSINGTELRNETELGAGHFYLEQDTINFTRKSQPEAPDAVELSDFE